MATQPATPISKPRSDDGMIEVKEPEFIQWKKQGQMVLGILLSIETTNVRDKESGEQKSVMEYMFLDDEGQRFRFLGNDDLNRKIWPKYLGHKLNIRYEADDTSRQQQGQNARKVFKVLASPNKMPGFEHLG